MTPPVTVTVTDHPSVRLAVAMREVKFVPTVRKEGTDLKFVGSELPQPEPRAKKVCGG